MKNIYSKILKIIAIILIIAFIIFLAAGIYAAIQSVNSVSEALRNSL